MIDGIGRSTLHSGTNPLTHTDMKTHFFYSPINKEVVAVVADSFSNAAIALDHMLFTSGTIVRDDYIYHGSLSFAENGIATIGVGAYDEAYMEANTCDDI